MDDYRLQSKSDKTKKAVPNYRRKKEEAPDNGSNIEFE
jgi:hypothetical protein